jgi:1-acyl-sn-glycerol-3-phosphate acyltransferase
VLTELGLYKLMGESPERTWQFALRFVTPITNLIAPSWGYGHDRVPETGGAVIAVNHLSAVDPALLGIHTPRTLYYMAKIELLSVPVAGELLRWAGAFAVRRGAGDRDSMRVARWAVREGHAVGLFMEGTRQAFGYPGPMHPGAAMVAIQEGVPVVPCGLDTFGWSLKNRRLCCVVWGEPIWLDLPRTGKGYKEGAALLEEEVIRLWRIAAQAIADGFPPELPDSSRRARASRLRHMTPYPELPTWPVEEWAWAPLGPVYKAPQFPLSSSRSGATSGSKKAARRDRTGWLRRKWG